MLFNSYLFIFAFFPLVMLLWHGLQGLRLPRAAQLVLVGMSLLFYGYGHPEYLGVILCSVAGNWCVSALMAAAERRGAGCGTKKGKLPCLLLGTLGILFNLGLLFYFKYYDFFVENVNRLAGTDWELKGIALPLGISFFTFQQIAFLADRMTGNAPHYPLLDYVNFVTFFPQLVAGPIVNHRDLVPQFERIGKGKGSSSAGEASLPADTAQEAAGSGRGSSFAGEAFLPADAAQETTESGRDGSSTEEPSSLADAARETAGRGKGRFFAGEASLPADAAREAAGSGRGGFSAEEGLCRGGGFLEKGACLFAVGLAKKVLLADRLGVAVDYGYGDVAGLDAVAAFTVMLLYTFQIYFDFSGYCDMAVGLGWMLGIDLPRNFDSPYKSSSVKEFWNRWHMTLNAFFTQYVYIPLGGGRRGLARKLRNTMVVFLISGIWHGAAWNFIVWGVVHGIAVCSENLFAENIFAESIFAKCHFFKSPSAGKVFPKNNSADWGSAGKLRWFLTFAFVNLAWVLFRSGSVSQALEFYGRLFSFTWTGKLWDIAGSMAGPWNYPFAYFIGRRWGARGQDFFYLALLVFLLLLSGMVCMGQNAYDRFGKKDISAGMAWLLGLLFALSVLTFSGVTKFLYFNF